MKIYGLCIFRLCTSWIKNNSDVHSVCVKTQALSGLNREVVCTRMNDQEEQCSLGKLLIFVKLQIIFHGIFTIPVKREISSEKVHEV